MATLQENMVTIASYTHNDLGERVIKDLGGGNITHYVFDLSGTLIAEADGTGATQREYIDIDGLPVGFVEGTTLYFVHPDHLGAPQKITDATKAVVWHGQFAPFGQQLSITGALTANWRFPGQYHDAEAALSYNYFRTYDPALGRYLQSDPIGLAGGLNIYIYALDNPIYWTDRSGNISLRDFQHFAEGFGSYYRGAYYFGNSVARRIRAFSDKDLENRIAREDACVIFAISTIWHHRRLALKIAWTYIKHNKARVAGRLISGTLNSVSANAVEPFLGWALNAAVITGDVSHAAETAVSAGELIESVVGGAKN